MGNDDTASVPLGEAPAHPPRIGPYRILGLIGEGGMGRVYRAREEHPPRDVALKLMRGMDSAARARFRREAELLAALEHPHIARLYAAGEADLGGLAMPWLALELVEGADLVTHARSAQLDLAARLRLLVAVCRAVHFAHGRGVIHRDLKPGNILVDPQGAPKILDFGIARLHDEDSAMTQQGQVLGTVPYMSPEQLAGRTREVDVRSDVYALGVIAYELIADRLPYPRLSTSSVMEALEIVHRESPEDLARLQPAARGDLSLVVMKALAGEAPRRYGSAAEFAADLERVLDHRPVEARPPTVGYLVSRFVRRHRALSAAAAVVLLVLVGATAVSLRYAVSEAEARALAEQRAAEAQAVSDFLADTLSSADPEKSLGRDLRMLEVMDSAALQLDSASFPPAVAVRLLHVLGKTQLNLGQTAEGERLLQRAIERSAGVGGVEGIRDETAVHLATASISQGRSDEAIAAIDALLAASSGLAPETEVLAGITRAQAQIQAGAREAAITALQALQPRADALLGADHKHSLTVRHNIAGALMEQDRLDEAVALAEEVLQRRREAFGSDHPEVLFSMNHLAAVYHRQGRSDEARELMQQTIEARTRVLGERHPSTLNSRRNLAVMRIQARQFDEALPELADIARLWEEIRGPAAPQIHSVRQLQAYVLQDLKRFEEAESVLRQVVASQIAAGGPKETVMLAPRNDLGMLLLDLGRPEEARVEFEGLMGWAEPMLDPGDLYLAIFRSNYGEALLQTRRWQAAREVLEPGHARLVEVLGAGHARSRTAAERLLRAYQGLGLREQAARLREGLDADA